MNYTKQAIDDKILTEMQKSTPEIYHDMVTTYGLDNVKNNYEVEFIILTEDNNVIPADGNAFDIDKKFIENVKNASLKAYEQYKRNPINKVKSWFNKSVGYSPIIPSHLPKEKLRPLDKLGYIVGDSYRVDNIDGKSVLLCKALLISPEAKYAYIIGGAREVSPTINQDNEVTELSYVMNPAQETNTSLSSGDNKVFVKAEYSDNFDYKIKQAELNYKTAKENAIIEEKQNLVYNSIENLCQKGLLPSGKKRQLESSLLSLSSGEDVLSVVKLIQNTGGFDNPMLSKAKTVQLRGNIEMNKNERWLKFVEENESKYPLITDLQTAFEKYDASRSVSLSAGEGVISDPLEDFKKALKALKEAKIDLTDDVKEDLRQLTAEMSLSSEEGKNVETGGVETPNNTSLSAPVIQAQDELTDTLHKAYSATKKELEELKSTLSNILGGSK